MIEAWLIPLLALACAGFAFTCWLLWRRWRRYARQVAAMHRDVVESAEAAEENSTRPETGAFAEQFASLCSDGPTYRELDVVEIYGG